MREAVTFLYRFFDIADSLLYVGISMHIEARFGQHRRLKPWDQVARIQLETFPTRAATLEAELLAIQSEHPIWNIAFAVPPPMLGCDHCRRPLKRYFYGWDDKRYCASCWEQSDLPPSIKWAHVDPR